jgi:hypothetical protein
VVFDLSCPIHDNEEERVVEAEMNPFLADFSQKDFVFLLEHGVFREESAFLS